MSIVANGALTYEGDKALGCIWNGALLAAGAGLSSIPLSFIIRGLHYLEGPTGCDGIVKWDMLNQIGNVATILNLIP